ncbi:MAG: toxin [Candidatus Roizmanbacteria bacterium]|nr:toxin [Candidatus Roizmanbacteria bacterium]
MPSFDWNEEKNKKLKRERGISFEHVVIAIKNDQALDITRSKNTKYEKQRSYIIEINDYIYVVPFVFDTKRKLRFLKTIYPSRKLTKKYLR